jgi:hypothetical protein
MALVAANTRGAKPATILVLWLFRMRSVQGRHAGDIRKDREGRANAGASDDLASSRRGSSDLPPRAEVGRTICGFSRRAQLRPSASSSKMTVLIAGRRFWLWRVVDDEGGEASDGRHFEILLNLTFGRAPPSGGLPSKRRIWWP